MRFCPYCGAELLAEGVRFCAGCGKELPVRTGKEKDIERAGETGMPERPEQQGKTEMPGREASSSTDDYDGYYDDILPADAGCDHDGPDAELIKKVALLLLFVLFVIGMCLALMYVV